MIRAGERKALIDQLLDNLSSLRALRVHDLGADTFHRDVSLPQLHLMAVLDERGEMTVSELANLFSVSLPSASSILDRLEDREYVARTRGSSDRRVVEVRITDKGHKAVQEFVGMKREEMLRLMTAMTDDELESFVQGMQAFLSAIRRLREAEDAAQALTRVS